MLWRTTYNSNNCDVNANRSITKRCIIVRGISKRRFCPEQIPFKNYGRPESDKRLYKRQVKRYNQPGKEESGDTT